MSKREVFERSHRDISFDVSLGVHILLVVDQSSLESQSRVCQDSDTYGYMHEYLFCNGIVYYLKSSRRANSIQILST